MKDSMKMREGISIVRLQEEDIHDIISLSRKVGWDYDFNEVLTVLLSGIVYGHKYREDLISCGAIINYENSISSIGMIIVDTQYQGFGLGKDVTQTCINSSPNDSVLLIATEEGKRLYEKMDFHEVDHVHKLIAEKYTGIKPQVDDYFVEPFDEIDISKIVALDESSFGGRRLKFLKNRIKQSHNCLILKNKFEEIVGFGMAISGPMNLVLGPIVAPDCLSASLLVHELSENHNDKLRIDVPSGHGNFLDFLKNSGFYEVRQPPLMALKEFDLPLRDGNMYGIAAQVFG